MATRWPRSNYTTLAIRNHHDSGNTIQFCDALAVLAGLFDHLGRHEAAATIAGFAFNPLTAALARRSSAPRSPTCAMSSATRPTKRSPARAKR